MSLGDRKLYLSAYSPSVVNKRRRQPDLRVLEGIKDKLQLLSEHSGTNEHSEKESDMIAVCDLADDFRDAILDYLVSHDIEVHTPGSSLTRLIALATKGNL